MEEKVRENRLRRAAKRQGYALRKSRARDPRAMDYGCYMLTDPYTNNMVVAGELNSPRAMTLEQVEAWLTSGGRRADRPSRAEASPAAHAGR